MTSNKRPNLSSATTTETLRRQHSPTNPPLQERRTEELLALRLQLFHPTKTCNRFSRSPDSALRIYRKTRDPQKWVSSQIQIPQTLSRSQQHQKRTRLATPSKLHKLVASSTHHRNELTHHLNSHHQLHKTKDPPSHELQKILPSQNSHHDLTLTRTTELSPKPQESPKNPNHPADNHDVVNRRQGREPNSPKLHLNETQLSEHRHRKPTHHEKSSKLKEYLKALRYPIVRRYRHAVDSFRRRYRNDPIEDSTLSTSVHRPPKTHRPLTRGRDLCQRGGNPKVQKLSAPPQKEPGNGVRKDEAIGVGPGRGGVQVVALG